MEQGMDNPSVCCSHWVPYYPGKPTRNVGARSRVSCTFQQEKTHMVGERVSGGQWIWAPCWVIVKEGVRRTSVWMLSGSGETCVAGYVRSHLA